MAWTWDMHLADGSTVEGGAGEGTAPAFPSQADAETWVGEHWRELLAGGVEAVTLRDDRRQVYGPMSLRPAG